MATTLMSVCECGLPYQIYVPKVTLYEWGLMGETGGDIEHFQEIDRKEMEDGEFAMAKSLAEVFGFQFMDSREVEKYSCPHCQRETRLFNVLKKLKSQAAGV